MNKMLIKFTLTLATACILAFMIGFASASYDADQSSRPKPEITVEDNTTSADDRVLCEPCDCTTDSDCVAKYGE